METNTMNSIEQKNQRINEKILQRRIAARSKTCNPQVGDWVIFNDCERRISYIWKYDENAEIKPVAEWGIQTSNPHSSYYLGQDGYISFSGGLYTSIRGELLQWLGIQKDASVWFFNRDHHCAHNGRTFQAPFEVWTVNQDASEI